MPSNSTTTGGPLPPGPPNNFNPLDQVSTLLYSDGVTPIPFNTMLVTDYYLSAISISIEYGSQIGANFIMLCVVLAMTPRTRFRRLPTLLSIASLAINTARMALLAVFFVTPWLDLYVIVSGDATFVPRSAFNLSAAATTLSVPVNVLILWALGLQAWSMTKLWRARVKIPAMGVSVVLILLTVTFSIMTTIIQTRAILFAEMPKESLVWVRQVYLAFITTAICWFCFLFNIRLVVHMWTNRTILPGLKGLKAMDVLVITNGVLMFVPVLFSILEFFNLERFEAGSLTQTSVIIVLPLGTLVAQRLANPTLFGTGPDPASGASACPYCGRGFTGHSSGGNTACITNPTATTDSQASTHIGGASMTQTTSHSTNEASKRPLLASWRGKLSGNRSVVSTYIGSDASDAEKGRTARQSDGTGGGPVGRSRTSEPDLEQGVKVSFDFERTEERVRERNS